MLWEKEKSHLLHSKCLDLYYYYYASVTWYNCVIPFIRNRYNLILKNTWRKFKKKIKCKTRRKNCLFIWWIAHNIVIYGKISKYTSFCVTEYLNYTVDARYMDECRGASPSIHTLYFHGRNKFKGKRRSLGQESREKIPRKIVTNRKWMGSPSFICVLLLSCGCGWSGFLCV